MNQILYTSEGKPRSPLPIETIVRFFAFSIIIFGIVFLGEGAYALFADEDNTVSDTSAPSVEFSRDENNNAIVSIKSNSGISLVKYRWNNNDEEIVSGHSKKEIELSDISIPSGKNVLYINIMNDGGISSNTSHEYEYEGIAIEFYVINGADIKFVASDVDGIDSLSYHWNTEDDLTIYPEEEGQTSLEYTVEIPSGENTLYVTAVNSSNVTLAKKKKVIGNKRPEIEFKIIDNSLCVIVKDEEGIDKVTQQINDNEAETFEANGEKEFKYRYILDDPNVKVTLTAVDVKGVEKTVKGE